MSPPDAAGERRRVRAVAACVVGMAALYTLHRAIVLRLEYYDGFEALLDARTVLGDPVGAYSANRPPFVVLAQLPAAVVARAAEPASVLWFVAPHLTSAVLSFAAAAALFAVYRRPLGATLATLGVALFMTTPFFVRYAVHAMGDVPAAGWVAVAVALYSRARARRSLVVYAACGLGAGAAIGTKYQLVVLVPVLALAEAAYSWHERRLDGRRWVGLGLAAATTVALFAALSETIVLTAYPGGLRSYLGALRQVLALNRDMAATHHESPVDYLPMAAVMIGIPTLLLAALGLARSLVERRADDIPFFAWLGVLGGGIVFFSGHTEARYLVPAVPALVYFGTRGMELLVHGRGAGRALAAALFAWAVGTGAWQAVLDRDPVFLSDGPRRAAQALLRARRPGGRFFWTGAEHTFHPRDPTEVPRDEYFDTFHFGSDACACLLGEPVSSVAIVNPDALAPRLLDGDAVMKGPPAAYETGTIPSGGVPPLEVLAVHRIALVPTTSGRFAAVEPIAVALTLREAGGQIVATPERDYGTWTVFLEAGRPGALYWLGTRELRAGGDVALAPGSPSAVTGIVLLRFDRTPF